jgi:hypothetical protein
MIKRIDPPDPETENYGFDVGTHEGRMLFMRYWHQLEHEEDEVELEEQEEEQPEEYVEDAEVDFSQDFQAQLAQYQQERKTTTIRFVKISVLLVIVTVMVTLFLSRHLKWV